MAKRTWTMYGAWMDGDMIEAMHLFDDEDKATSMLGESKGRVVEVTLLCDAPSCESCQGCATARDSEGVPLCARCLDALRLENA